ncbi:MAG: PEP-CTERM sorting domain-containing protein [Deltaproteobacteria bacterium]|nr:PEP-CTERM sorting domain-containing protein [Deltaproteobacteria bacterium]
MKNSLRAILLSFFFLFLLTGISLADSFGTNITIYDENGYTGIGQGGEDKETEPGMINNQSWDLEGFFLDGTTLTMVGGFDFVNGVPRYPDYTSGDIFIDIDGDAEYGDIHGTTGNNIVTSTFGYDYALDLDFTAKTYNVIELNGASTVTVWYAQNQGSNPWLYNSGGSDVESGMITYETGLSDGDTGFVGGSHYAAAVDLAFLGSDINNFTAHFTMGCGNDNLMGKVSNPVPEPATMLLFGSGLIGLAGMSRRKLRKS